MSDWDSIEVELDEGSLEAMRSIGQTFRDGVLLELSPSQVCNMLIGIGARALRERLDGQRGPFLQLSEVEVLPPERSPAAPDKPKPKRKRKALKRKASKTPKPKPARSSSRSSSSPSSRSATRSSSKLCLCGCGEPAAKGRAYKWGHKLAAEQAALAARGEPAGQVVFSGGEGLTRVGERKPLEPAGMPS